MLEVEASVAILILGPPLRIVHNCWVEQGYCNRSSDDHSVAHLTHAKRNLPGDEVDVSSIKAIFGLQVLRVTATGVEQSKENVTEAGPYQQKASYNQPILPIVVAAFRNHQLESQRRTKGVECEREHHKSYIQPYLLSKEVI